MTYITGSLKTSGVGYFLIPAGPGAGVTLTVGGSAWTYGAWTQLIASTAAALYIIGILIDPATVGTSSQHQVQIGIGAANSETGVSEVKHYVGSGVGSVGMVPFPIPIPVAASIRISARVAGEGTVGTIALTLICISQANVTS